LWAPLGIWKPFPPKLCGNKCCPLLKGGPQGTLFKRVFTGGRGFPQCGRPKSSSESPRGEFSPKRASKTLLGAPPFFLERGAPNFHRAFFVLLSPYKERGPLSKRGRYYTGREDIGGHQKQRGARTKHILITPLYE